MRYIKLTICMMSAALFFSPISSRGADTSTTRPDFKGSLLLASCNVGQASVCQQQAQSCGRTICGIYKYGTASEKNCWNGCLSRYNQCKFLADCR